MSKGPNPHTIAVFKILVSVKDSTYGMAPNTPVKRTLPSTTGIAPNLFA